jgi:transposase
MKFERCDLDFGELTAILDRAGAGGALSPAERDKLKAALDTLAFLTNEIGAKGMTIERLRRILFGASTEKTDKVFPDPPPGEGSAGSPAGAGDTPSASGTPPPRRPGHGRNGAAAYPGATKVCLKHGTLHAGDRCPECLKGKLYAQPQPAVLVRLRGMAPLAATLYELERLRCSLCGEVFTAPAPDGVGTEKYDPSAAAMIALLKYGCGLPFNRIEKLQRNLGIPMPAATQWELVHTAAQAFSPAHQELIRQAAQGEIVHNDDTTMTLLAFGKSPFPEDEQSETRTGVYTSGIVSRSGAHAIALYFTGRKHAGENLARVLAERATALPPPIQMCDALSHNTAGDFDSIVANCLAHGRRQFVELAPSFPGQCRYVLETLREVYRHDATARVQQLAPAARLAFHQEHSGPLMRGLLWWLYEQIEHRKVEPNSTLGGAVNYMRKHWLKLTLFLREPGAPLDNNLCERALKKAILHRKNSLFYKTENGAAVGDLFMSLIHTAELGQVDPFDYLVELQRHATQLKANPGQWMPWNYRATLATLSAGSDPPR